PLVGLQILLRLDRLAVEVDPAGDFRELLDVGVKSQLLAPGGRAAPDGVPGEDGVEPHGLGQAEPRQRLGQGRLFGPAQLLERLVSVDATVVSFHRHISLFARPRPPAKCERSARPARVASFSVTCRCHWAAGACSVAAASASTSARRRRRAAAQPLSSWSVMVSPSGRRTPSPSKTTSCGGAATAASLLRM